MDVYILNRRPRRRPPFLCDFSRQFLANRVICTKIKLEIKGRRKKEREHHERTFFYFCTTTHDEQLLFCRSATYLFTFCVRAKLVFRLFSPQFLQFKQKKAETSRICIPVKCRKNVFCFIRADLPQWRDERSRQRPQERPGHGGLQAAQPQGED